MKNEEYISISEFAKRAGVSRAYIYKILSTKLTEYCKQVDSQKMLNIKALTLFDVNKSVNRVNQGDSDVDSMKDLIEILQEQMQTLKVELDMKNEQISTQMKLTDQAQHLQLMAEKKIELLEDKKGSAAVVPDPNQERQNIEKEFLDKIKREYIKIPHYESEEEHLRILRAMLPKSPGVFSSSKKIEIWAENRRKIFERMTEEELELLKKYGLEEDTK